jgi:uncharacterized damage-inducible protein DinB
VCAYDWAGDLKQAARQKLMADLAQVARCARLLSNQQIWRRENEHCNSIGNLILHLTGNVRQWIVAGIGGERFDRDRPAEFAQRQALPTEQILDSLRATVSEALAVIDALAADAFGRRCSIQGYDVTAFIAVVHVIEHFSFHAGQIVHMTKAILDVDLSLYDALGRRSASRGGWPW